MYSILFLIYLIIYIHFTEGNINILKNDSNNLSEQLVHNNNISECLKSEIDGKIDNELEPSNYM